MASAGTELVRVTVETPDRRVDVALPERVPVATLLPALLAAGGDELADRGALHAGWVLRGTTGRAIDTSQGLADQGVRDGDVLCLGFADESWPDLDYDDAVEAIAVGASRRGRRWDERATRRTSIAFAIVLYAGALVGVSTAGPPWSVATVGALAFAVLLVAAAVVAARAFGDVGVGTLLGALALPFAFVGGVLASASLADSSRAPLATLVDTPGQLAVGSVALIVFAMAAAIGIGRTGPEFVAGVVAGLAGVLDSVIALSTTSERSAAVTLGVLVLFAGFAPAVAARVGGLPRPQNVAPAGAGPTPGPRTFGQADPGAGGSSAAARRGAPGPVDTDVLFAAVSRTDNVLTGLLVGIAVATAAASAVLAIEGGWPARLLLLAAAGSFALRGRMYAAFRHRTAALITAGLAGAPLIAVGIFVGAAALLVAAVFGVVGLITIALGAGSGGVEHRSPYLGRLADLAELVSLAAIVPLVCVVLGLYARLRGLHL